MTGARTLRACIALAAALSAACAATVPPDPLPYFAVTGLDTERVELPALEGGANIVAVRLAVDAGAVDVLVAASGRELARRRVARIGENLAILPLPATVAAGASVALADSGRGPRASARIADVRLFATTEASAAALARAIGREFERETGRIADPAADNLVANPDFAADDEVRGTPADWFAYASTAFDPAAHELRVDGSPGAGRPYLATAPIPVGEGARYRVVCRLEVDRGAVVLRAVDYDELVEVAAAPRVEAGAGPAQREMVFTVPAGCPAVRLRFEAPEAGAPATFRVALVQMEELAATGGV